MTTVLVYALRTIKKLDEIRGATDTLDQRKLSLWLAILTFLINLLMDMEANLAEGSFLEPFMGSEHIQPNNKIEIRREVERRVYG